MSDFEIVDEENGNYSIYVVRDGEEKWIVDVEQDAIGVAVVTLRNDREWTDNDRVGIRERTTRKWIINPHATGGKT